MDENVQKKDPYIVFAVAIDQGETTTVNLRLSELPQWLNAELDAWAWLTGSIEAPSKQIEMVTERMLKPIKSWLGMTRDMIDQDIASQPDPNRSDKFGPSKLASRLGDHFRGGAVYSKSPAGVYILGVAKAEPTRALYLLASALGVSMHAEAGKHEHELRSHLEFVRDPAAAERKLQLKYDGWMEHQTRLMNELSADFKNWREAQEKKVEDGFTKTDGEMTKLADDAKERFDALYDSAAQKIGLSQPIEFWRKKRFWHRWIVIAMVPLTALIAYVFLDRISQEGDHLNAVLSGKTVADVVGQPWRLVTLLVMGAVGFWVLKIMVRIILMQIHLAHDASERMTMTETYISLLSLNQLRNANEDVIVGALFRPAGDGLIKEEGIPFALAEFLKKS